MLQELTKQKRNLRRTIKQLSAYVATLTSNAEEDVSPEQCAAEEILALRAARLQNADLLQWTPRAVTYAEGVRI